MEWIGLVTLLTNVVVPPAFNLIKSWLSKGKADSPEQTISNLATTRPEVLPNYIEALSKLKDAETRYFNRDITGIPSQKVIDLRACIRPLSVVMSFGLLFASLIFPDLRNLPVYITCNGVIGNWIGCKVEIHP